MFKEVILSLALSSHVGFDNSYNEIHPHIRFKTDNTISGAFYNSERTISFYTGKDFTFDNFTVDIGIVTGYYGVKIAPMVIIKKNNFFIMPGVENKTIGLVFGYEHVF